MQFYDALDFDTLKGKYGSWSKYFWLQITVAIIITMSCNSYGKGIILDY